MRERDGERGTEKERDREQGIEREKEESREKWKSLTELI